MIQSIRGFKDILPGEAELWQYVENKARTLFRDFGFKEIKLPLLEQTELFARSIGEETDIVEKEMYTFPDRKGELVTLRPEATASVVRAYIQHKMYAADPVCKFFTIGPMFRRERPQKGRYRQFYQINAEVFGSSSPLMDAQLIFWLMTLFSNLLVEDVHPHINSLGCHLCRPDFKTAISSFLAKLTDKLCDDCNRRSNKNPLRVLDCKVPSCKEAILEAPSIQDFLCKECNDHFNKVKDALGRLNISYVIDKNLVRGLDYYNRTTFEIQTNLLGAQNAVAGGGRYDGLVKVLGGPDQPAVGFAVGFDRLVDILAQKNIPLTETPDILIAPIGEQTELQAFEWACFLSREGIKAEIDLGGKNLKSMMKRADRLGASYVMIVGEKELEEKSVVLRNMTTKDQIFIPIDDLFVKIKEIIKH